MISACAAFLANTAWSDAMSPFTSRMLYLKRGVPKSFRRCQCNHCKPLEMVPGRVTGKGLTRGPV